MFGSRSWLLVAVAAATAYLVGSVSPASLLAHALRADLAGGSGNPGATNAGRVLGVRWGVVVGVLDVLKGLVPTLLALGLLDRFVAYVVGLACVLGHVVSPFLRGRGGKGVATSLGVVLALHPWFVAVALVVFAVAMPCVRSVGLSSCLAVATVGLLGAFGPMSAPVVVGRVWCILLAVVVISRHRANLARWLGDR